MFETRILVKNQKPITNKGVLYSNAEKFAKEIEINPELRYNAVLSGNFVFGDFIEALILEHELNVKNLKILSLSADLNNIESLIALMDKKWVTNLDLILSTYFYGFNRKPKGLIEHITKEILDKYPTSTLSIAEVHSKIFMIETFEGQKIVCYGSANLPSSNNIEQMMIEFDPEIYDFHEKYFDEIKKQFKVIQKPIRNKEKLWQMVTTQTEMEM